jgi:hypothetical protein
MRAGRWLTAALVAAMTGPAAHAQSDPATATAPQSATTSASQAAPPATAPSNASPAKKPAPPPQPKDAYKPLVHASLVVWLVEPSGGGPTMIVPGTEAPTPITYQERTPSGFGQTAGNYGTDAGKFGVDADSRAIARVPNNDGPDADAAAAAKAGYQEQTSGSFGQNSAGYGNAASNHGQTASSYGQTAGNYGIDSSKYGVDASDYGSTVSTLTAATEPGPPAPAPVPFADQLQNSLATTFPALHVHYVDVGSGDMNARLRAAASTREYPDVVILDGFATSWPGFPDDVRDALLPSDAPVPNRSDRVEDRLPPTWYVTRHAPHTTAAHAL